MKIQIIAVCTVCTLFFANYSIAQDGKKKQQKEPVVRVIKDKKALKGTEKKTVISKSTVNTSSGANKNSQTINIKKEEK